MGGDVAPTGLKPPHLTQIVHVSLTEHYFPHLAHLPQMWFWKPVLAEFPLASDARVLQEPRVPALFLCVCLAQGLFDDASMPEEQEELNVAQSHPTLCDPMGHTVSGILHGQNTGVG